MEKNIPPVGAIVFIYSDNNPAEMWFGTEWEEVVNNIYFIAPAEINDPKDLTGAEKPRSYRRVK